MTKAVPKFDFDKKFQARLVRALYQFPDESYEVLSSLDSAMFDTAPLRWTVRKLQTIRNTTGAPASLVALEYEAQKDVRAGVVKAAHVDAYAACIAALRKPVPDKSFILDRAHEYTRFVSLREFVIQAADKLQSGKPIDWRKVDNDLSSQLNLSERTDSGMGLDFFGQVDARLKRRETQDVLGIPTGLPIDDEMRVGGMPPKQLGVIVAPPGRGKSTMLVYIGGSAVLLGKNVLHISVELDEDMLAEKYDARFTSFRIQNLKRLPNKLSTRLDAVRRAGGGRLLIKYFPPDALTVAGLRSFLKRLEASAFYPDVVLIDYADNMSLREFGGGGDSDYGPLGRLYVALRGLAGEFNLPVWTASQSNRQSVEKKTLGIQDLADSFKKAAVADVLVGVVQDDKERLRNVATLVLAKNRNGATGKSIQVQFNTSKVQIHA